MLGLDLLGVGRYATAALEAFPRGFACGLFGDPGLFGETVSFVEELARSGKCPLFRIHLAWDDDHHFPASDFDRIARRADPFETLARKFPRIKFYLSGACEHRLDRKSAEALRGKVLKRAPHCEYVNVPIQGGALISGINEVHGTSPRRPPRPYFVSWDGDSCLSADTRHWKNTYNDAEVLFFWDYRCNGRRDAKDNTPRAQRKAFCTTEDIKQLIGAANR
jgi:hypothetical protein